MTLRDTISGIARKVFHREQEEYGDYETRDQYLRSLRRERRIQMEQIEKKRLKAQIEVFKRKQREEHLWGFRNNILSAEKNKPPHNKQRWL